MTIADDLINSISQLPQLARRTDANPTAPTLADIWEELPEIWRSALVAWLGKEGSDDRLMQEFKLGGQRAIRIQTDVLKRFAFATTSEAQEAVQAIETEQVKEDRKQKRHKKDEVKTEKDDDASV